MAGGIYLKYFYIFNSSPLFHGIKADSLKPLYMSHISQIRVCYLEF